MGFYLTHLVIVDFHHGLREIPKVLTSVMFEKIQCIILIAAPVIIFS